MAGKKSDDQPDVPSEAPVEPSKARKAFLAGEMTWDEYCAAENEADAPSS